MNYLNSILTVMSFVSFGIAVFSFIRNHIKEVNEKANMQIIREKLKALHLNLISQYHTTDAIVQIPKKEQQTTISELQNLARVARGQIYTSMENIKEFRGDLDEWRFGKMIKGSESVYSGVPMDRKEDKDNQ